MRPMLCNYSRDQTSYALNLDLISSQCVHRARIVNVQTSYPSVGVAERAR
jgi:hypothetical protein